MCFGNKIKKNSKLHAFIHFLLKMFFEIFLLEDQLCI